MTPMDESELRDELRHADAGVGPRPDALSASVIKRGRGVRQRRTVMAGVTAILLVGTGIGLGSALNGANRDAIPAGTPSASPSSTQTHSVSPTPAPTVTPTPTATATTTATATVTVTVPATSNVPPAPTYDASLGLPTDFGDVGDAKMPHEISGAGTWNLAEVRVGCGSTPFTLPALGQLAGGKSAVVESEGESYGSESVLVFTSEAAAAEFMTQLSQEMRACVAEGPTLDEPSQGSPVLRNHKALHVDPTRPDALTLSFWTEAQLEGDDQWGTYPGGDFSYWARKGAVVIRAEWAGEYVGDIVSTQPDSHDELRTTVLDALEKA